MNIDNAMLKKCLSWFGETEEDRPFTEKNVHLIDKEDIDGYHRRIYLVAYTEDKGFSSIYLIRVWGSQEETLSLSEDFVCTTVSTEELLGNIPSLIKRVLEVK